MILVSYCDSIEAMVIQKHRNILFFSCMDTTKKAHSVTVFSASSASSMFSTFSRSIFHWLGPVRFCAEYTGGTSVRFGSTLCFAAITRFRWAFHRDLSIIFNAWKAYFTSLKYSLYWTVWVKSCLCRSLFCSLVSKCRSRRTFVDWNALIICTVLRVWGLTAIYLHSKVDCSGANQLATFTFSKRVVHEGDGFEILISNNLPCLVSTIPWTTKATCFIT